jgi:hypothetical protein
MKAQLTIEFLIILVVLLLLFNGISMDLIDTSVKDALFVQTSEIVQSAALSLNNTAQALVFQGSGAKKTLLLRAPSECDYIITADSVTLSCDPLSAVWGTFNGKVIAWKITGIVYGPVGKIDRGKMGELFVAKP